MPKEAISIGRYSGKMFVAKPSIAADSGKYLDFCFLHVGLQHHPIPY
jgi:hypothetical protein